MKATQEEELTNGYLAGADEGVVVALDAEGPGAVRRPPRLNLDLAGVLRLDPDRRVARPRVAEERAKDEVGHADSPGI